MADPARTSEPRTRPRRRMPPEQRRDHLVSTALQLYGERSPEDTAVDDVVEAADVSRALFYRYFTNIRELHLTALGRVVDDLVAQLVVPSTGDFRGDLRAALDRFLVFAHTYAASYTALLSTGSSIADDNTAPLIDGVRDHTVGQVRERLGLAELPGAVERTLRGWMAAVEATVLSWLQNQDVTRGELGSWLTDQLLAMLATTAQHDSAAAKSLRDVLAG